MGQGEDEEKRSVLHGKLVRLAEQIAAVAAGVALVTLGVLVIRQVMVEKTEEEAKAEQQAKAYVAHVMTAITVLVVAIPEGLPLAVTLALAYSVKKTTADHNRVRHLHACETMGNATTICTDKTGTLTTNRMAVVRTFLCGEERGQGTSQTSLVTSLPAQARELLGQAVAYNSSYSSRLEERDGLAVQRDIEQDEEQREEDGHLHGPAPAGLQGQQQRHTAQEQQQHGPALDSGRTAPWPCTSPAAGAAAAAGRRGTAPWPVPACTSPAAAAARRRRRRRRRRWAHG